MQLVKESSKISKNNTKESITVEFRSNAPKEIWLLNLRTGWNFVNETERELAGFS